LTTLLAVDDSVTMRKVLEITFAGEEYRHLSASGGDAALEVVRRDKPDIVLLDISLPGQDGYAICAQVKAAHPRAFVVLLSSKQVAYDAARGAAAGADDFADKPFDTQQMIDKIRKVLAGQPVAPTAPAAAPPAPAEAPAPPAPRPVAPSLGAAPAASPFAQNTQMFGSASPPAATPAAAHSALTTPPAAHATSSRTEPSMEHLRAAPPPAPAADRTLAAMAPIAAASPPAAAAAVQVLGATASLGPKLAELGLTAAQVDAVLALSREVVERVVWEVVPTLAETIIKEEVRRLTAE